jgi:hypothetical protein
MKLRSLVYQVAVGVWAISAFPGAAYAQSNTGLNVLISGVKHAQKTITLQFTASNKSNSRIYIRNTSFDNTESASLDSGETLLFPRVTGIEDCRHDLNNCLGQNGTDLNEYSYIDPGTFLVFTLTYQTRNPVNDNDTISLPVSLVARYAKQNDESQAGGTKLVKFHFNKPLNQQ